MISLRERLHSLPALCGGLATALLLVLVTHINSGAEPALVLLMAALPFLLATLMGLAKTTTA